MKKNDMTYIHNLNNTPNYEVCPTIWSSKHSAIHGTSYVMPQYSDFLFSTYAMFVVSARSFIEL